MAAFAYFLILWGSYRGAHYASLDNVVDVVIIVVVRGRSLATAFFFSLPVALHPCCSCCRLPLPILPLWV